MFIGGINSQMNGLWHCFTHINSIFFGDRGLHHRGYSWPENAHSKSFNLSLFHSKTFWMINVGPAMGLKTGVFLNLSLGGFPQMIFVFFLKFFEVFSFFLKFFKCFLKFFEGY